jgi:hypothetical protein
MSGVYWMRLRQNSSFVIANPDLLGTRQSLHFQQALRLLRSLLSLAMALLVQALDVNERPRRASSRRSGLFKIMAGLEALIQDGMASIWGEGGIPMFSIGMGEGAALWVEEISQGRL